MRRHKFPSGASPQAERWWIMILAGLVSLYGAYWLHERITRFEQGEEGLGLTRSSWVIYNALGKWGVVGVLLAACPIFIAYGIYLRNRKHR
jgi:hypothetical protein